MKPAPFEYVRAESVADAVAALARDPDESAVLAGGQSLVPLLNLRLARPAVLVDVNRIAELSYVDVRDDRVVVGAVTRASTLERHGDVRRLLPVVVEALRHVGHPQIRNRTTVAGNVAHADPASELPAVLLALGGEVTLRSASGERRVGAAEFFADVFTTTRRPDELVVAVTVPVRAGMRLAFREVARRHGDYALVGACVGVEVGDDGLVRDARIALSGVGRTPVRVASAEDALRGGPPDAARISATAAVVSEAIDPPDDLHASSAYRRSVAATLVRRMLGELTGAAA